MLQQTIPTRSSPPTGKGAAYRRAQVGESKSVILTRPYDKAWTCPRCSRISLDIRSVCGSCLNPEPSTDAAASAKDPQKQERLYLRPPGYTKDTGVRLHKMPNTHRVYRQFMEPLEIKGKKKKSSLDSCPDIVEGEENSRSKINEDNYAKAIFDGENDSEDEPLGEFVRPTKRDMVGLDFKKTSPPPRSTKKSPGFTHFISLPIGKLPALRPLAGAFLKALRDFLEKGSGVDDVATSNESSKNKEKGDRRFDVRYPTPGDVANVDKLHITLLMLSLQNEKDVKFAKSLLHVFAERWASFRKSELEKETPDDTNMAGLRLTLGGLQAMPNRSKGYPDPCRTGVVYMELHHTTLLSQLQNLLFNTFSELISDQSEADHSKFFHMTIINKKWSSDQKSKLFDATGVLKRFGKATIGKMEANGDAIQQYDVWVDRLELNRRFTAGCSTNEYYVEDVVTL